MTQSRKCIATSAILSACAALVCLHAQAAPAAGKLDQVSGTVLVSRADGRMAILARDSVVSVGDTLQTQKGTYASISLSDHSQLILEPDTALRIDRHVFDVANPAADDAAYTLLKGGLKFSSGELGRRSPARNVLSTALSVIGLESASAYIVFEPEQVIASARRQAWMLASTAALAAQTNEGTTPFVSRPLLLAQLQPPASTARAPGLYVQVLDGLIHVTNPTGTTNFSAGQFGYTASITKPPVVVPANPGMQFSPPPSFSTTPAQAAAGSAKAGTVDCEVR